MQLLSLKMLAVTQNLLPSHTPNKYPCFSHAKLYSIATIFHYQLIHKKQETLYTRVSCFLFLFMHFKFYQLKPRLYPRMISSVLL